MVGSPLLETRVTPESPLCKVPVCELQLSEDVLLASYTRVGVVTSVAAEDRIRRYFEEEFLVERS
ncbi:hypothetical protein BH23CHL2_BH23CHL2_01730 [soil metagenome]